MAIAFVAAVFDGSLENGCEVVKLPLARAQAPKTAEQAQQEAVAIFFLLLPRFFRFGDHSSLIAQRPENRVPQIVVPDLVSRIDPCH